jgi:tetratricopeptide (TPR) repeat protein
MSTSRFRRLLGIAGLLLLPAMSAGAAGNERWLKVSTAEFMIITELSERQAVTWAGEFSQFITALKLFLPVDTRALPPLTVVILRDRTFQDYRPLGADGRPKAAAGFFNRRPSWAVAGLGTADFDRVRSIIFHEGTHWFMSAFRQASPLWVEEGIAELFSTFTVDGKNVSFGQAIGPHINVLNALEPIPMERFLFLSRNDLFTGDSESDEKTGIAYAQSWAFMHYLIFGENAATTRQAFIDYLRAVAAGTHADEAFKNAFGLTYQQMDAKLREYVRFGRYFTLKKPVAPANPPKVEPASTLEVEIALGRLSLAGARYQDALKHVEKAGVGPNDGPDAFVLQGEILVESRDADRAKAAFETALARGSKDFRPHFELANAQYRTALALGIPITPEEARQIANGFERAINANPQFRFSYVGLSAIATRLPAGATDDRAFLEMGLKIFPADPDIRMGLAALARRDGDRARAMALYDEVLTSPNRPSQAALKAARASRSVLLFEDASARAGALEKEKKFAEAIAVVQAAMAEARETTTERRLLTLLNNVKYAERSEAIRVASEAGNWTETRRLIEEMLAGDYLTPLRRTQAENRLKDLDRRGLGK